MDGNRDLAALPRLVRLIRAGRLRPRAHPPLPRLRLRPDRRAAGGGPGRRRHRALPGRRADRGPPAHRRGPRAVSGQRAARPATVAVSATVADRLRRWGVPAPRIEVVPNGIDARPLPLRPGRRAPHPRAARPARRTPSSSAASAGSCPASASTSCVRAVRRTARTSGCCWSAAARSAARSWHGCAAQLGVADRVRLLGERDGRRVAARRRSRRAARTAGRHGRVRLARPPRRPSGSPSWRRSPPGCPCCYVTCPAVDDLPPDEAPGARRVAARRPPLVARARRGLRGATRGRRRPPAARPAGRRATTTSPAAPSG